jgi:hypothetical protein
MALAIPDIEATEDLVGLAITVSKIGASEMRKIVNLSKEERRMYLRVISKYKGAVPLQLHGVDADLFKTAMPLLKGLRILEVRIPVMKEAVRLACEALRSIPLVSKISIELADHDEERLGKRRKEPFLPWELVSEISHTSSLRVAKAVRAGTYVPALRIRFYRLSDGFERFHEIDSSVEPRREARKRPREEHARADQLRAKRACA